MSSNLGVLPLGEDLERPAAILGPYKQHVLQKVRTSMSVRVREVRAAMSVRVREVRAAIRVRF
jgi:hypothetical protein